MRKIYSLIALMLTCFVGSANAQQWVLVDDANVDVIEPGVTYVIQQGDNTNEDGSAGQHARGLYLGSSGLQSPVEDGIFKPECGFQFEKAGEKDGVQLYYLKNVANGKYLANAEERYTTLSGKAFVFAAQKAVAVDEPKNADGNWIPLDTKKVKWSVYSKAVSKQRSRGAEGLGAWVFCSESDNTYMCFYGSPAFDHFIDTNNWLVMKVEGEEMTEYEKFLAVYDKYYAEFNIKDYHVGKDPGCVTEEFYTRFKAIHDLAEAASDDKSTPDEQCKKLADDIVKIFEELKTAVIPVGPGYFVLKNLAFLSNPNDIRGFLTVTDDGSRGRGNTANMTTDAESYKAWTPEDMTAWTVDNAKYIWKIEAGEKEGELLFKNFGTDKYLTKNNDYATTDKVEEATPFISNNFKGLEFTITYEGGMLHVANHSQNKLLNYQNANDPASRFQYYSISQVVIDSLTSAVSHGALVAKTNKLLKSAQETLLSLQYKNGFVESAMYNAPADSGLTTKMVGNATDASYPASNMFDGKANTYYHTDGKVAGRHYIEMDLGKEVSEVVLKFSKRIDTYNNHVSQFELQAPDDTANLSTSAWTKVAESNFKDSIQYTYTVETDTTIHKWHKFLKEGTFIGKYKLSKPSRYLRFVVNSTWGRNTYTGENGPIWHMAEFRIYDGAETVANPNFFEVPQEVRDALDAAIKLTKQQLADDTITEETYTALEEALDAFNEAYPDPSSLKGAVKDAIEKVGRMVEYEAEPLMGYFAPGAKATATEELTAIDNAIKDIEGQGKSLSLEEIKTFEAKLDKVLADFNAKLVTPVSGKIYRMMCTAGTEENGKDRVQNNAYIASVNADYVNGSPVWRYKGADIANRFNTIWLVEGDANKGFSFKNLANGLYMNNVYEGLSEKEIEKLELKSNELGYSKTPKYFKLEAYAAENGAGQGFFIATLAKGQYLNFQGWGKTMVHYEDPVDPNAPFVFQEIDEIKSSMQIDVPAGRYSILSVPFEAGGAYTENADYFEVLGIHDNVLEVSSATDVIPAGTPFIVKTDAAETFVSVVLNSTDEADLVNMTYNYEPVVKNGLVSAPVGFKIEKGTKYGIFLENNSVGAAEGNEYVEAGTGFFNNTIPATTATGDDQIKVEGEITGEGTAVEEVVVVKNVPTDVYTISGVKVRHNVKAADATKGLPQGLYIVGGQKVLVK